MKYLIVFEYKTSTPLVLIRNTEKEAKETISNELFLRVTIFETDIEKDTIASEIFTKEGVLQ